MNKFELAATVSKYIAVASCMFLIGHFGLHISFDKK